MQQSQQSPSTPAPATQIATQYGWLTRLKRWIVGSRDPVDQQLHEVARQGAGMVRLAHFAGALIIISFSLGSAVGICSTLIDGITRNGPLTWAALPLDIAFGVSLLMVFGMDIASLYAAFVVRLLFTRRSPWGDYVWHVAMIVFASILESGTFAYMSWRYDNPAVMAVAVLILVRAIGAPIFALYLNMARQIPVGTSDMQYHSFLASGKGVIREVINIANDHTAPLAHKVELFAASYPMSDRERQSLDRLIEVTKKYDAGQSAASTIHAMPRTTATGAAYAPHIATETIGHLPDAALAHREMHDWPDDDDQTIDRVTADSNPYATQETPALTAQLIREYQAQDGGASLPIHRLRGATDSGPDSGARYIDGEVDDWERAPSDSGGKTRKAPRSEGVVDTTQRRNKNKMSLSKESIRQAVRTQMDLAFANGEIDEDGNELPGQHCGQREIARRVNREWSENDVDAHIPHTTARPYMIAWVNDRRRNAKLVRDSEALSVPWKR